MTINNVSFGRVIAVSGKANKVNRVNKKLYPHAEDGKLIMKDVTYYYKNLSPTGVLAGAVQKKGDVVEVYITGKDLKNVEDKVPGWDTLSGILAKQSLYYDVNKVPVNTVINHVFENM